MSCAENKYLFSGLLGIDRSSFKNNINFSVFDYAVVSYWLDCKTSAERESRIDELNQEIESIGLKWFKSQSDLISEYYRLLSLLQPLYNAEFVVNGDYKFRLQEMERNYIPPLINEDKRLKLIMDLET